MPVPVQRLPLDSGPPLPKPGRAHVMGSHRHMLDTACVEGDGHSPSNDSPRVCSDVLDASDVQSSARLGSSRVRASAISDGCCSSLPSRHHNVDHLESRPIPTCTPTSSITDKWVDYLRKRDSRRRPETTPTLKDRFASNAARKRKPNAQRLPEDLALRGSRKTAGETLITSSDTLSTTEPHSAKRPRPRTVQQDNAGEIPTLSLKCTHARLREEDSKSSNFMDQPDTRPISQDQLVAEVKGIYAGLVMVETKCIEVDKAQPPNANTSKLNNEEWQALIALHRTLLHEHHDFFLASQHPSASPALHRLTSKCAMPARMWRHGIHSLLELLRHPQAAFPGHMLMFIYLAYSMMALLYETIPAFEDTLIECLGDLRSSNCGSGIAM